MSSRMRRVVAGLVAIAVVGGLPAIASADSGTSPAGRVSVGADASTRVAPQQGDPGRGKGSFASAVGSKAPRPSGKTRVLSASPATLQAAPSAAPTAALAPEVVSAAADPRAGWGYIPVPPARVLDTRPGQSTVDNVAAGAGALGPQGYYDFSLANRAGLPAAGEISAVVVNLTGIAPTQATYLSVIPWRPSVTSRATSTCR